MRQCLRITVLLLVAGLVMLGAGCGGGSNNGTTTGPSGNGGPTGHGGPGGFTSAANCREFAGLADQVAGTLSSLDNGNVSSDTDTVAQRLQALADAAPSDIKADLQTIASAFSGYVKAIEDSGFDPNGLAAPTAAQIAALEKAAKAFSSAKFLQAAQRLGAWAQKKCK